MELVWKEADCTIELNGTTLCAAPKDHAPFSFQAIVEEQDTQLLLSEQTILTDPGKPAWYLANTLEQQATHSLGEVLIRGQTPKRLLAIIHDIEQSPTSTPDTVKRAYENILTIIVENNIASLALPLLGTVHGKLTLAESLRLLGSALELNPPSCLQRIWLILPKETNCTCLSLQTLL